MIGGFSQGGCVALAAAFKCPQPLAGVVALSSVFPRGVADKPAPGPPPQQTSPTTHPRALLRSLRQTSRGDE